MNLNYINGFFDADGSITIAKNNSKDKYKSLHIAFHNTEKIILEQIQLFLLHTYSIKGYISSKRTYKPTHKVGYTLAYRYNSANELAKLLTSMHPKKLHRLNTYKKYYKNSTKRNGKYSTKEHNRKLAYERLFLWTSFS